MASTRNSFTGDGTTTTYDVDFELGYISEDHIYVYLADTTYDDQLDYEWISDTQIELDEAVDSGTEFYVRRVVPRTELTNSYVSGALFKEANIDDSLLQALMIIEELQDGFSNTSGSATQVSDLDLNDLYKVVNMVDPEDDQDGATKKYVDELVEDASGYADEAAASVTAATVSANAAAASAASAADDAQDTADDVVTTAANVDAAETASTEAAAAAVLAEQYRDETKAISGLGDIADVLGTYSPANIDWDLVIPFNDGARIETGYGTNDTITVDSVDYELPTRSVDVSRASSVWAFNKSGLPTEFDDDELVIGSGGAAIFQAYTNSLGWGTDAEYWRDKYGSVDNETLDDVNYIKFTEESDPWYHYITYSGMSEPEVESTDTVCYQMVIHKSSTRDIKLIVSTDDGDDLIDIRFYMDTGTTDDVYGVSYVTDKGTSWVLTVHGNAVSSSYIEDIQIFGMKDGEDIYDGVEEGYFYVTQCMLILNGPQVADIPYVGEDFTSEASRAADVVSVTAKGNMPATGEAFAVIADVYFGGDSSNAPRIVRLGESTSGTSLHILSSNYPAFWVSDGSTIAPVTGSFELTEGVYRVIGGYSKERQEVFLCIDGVEAGITSFTGTPTYDATDDLYIGSYNGTSQHLNGYLKNLGILQGEISYSEITALGSAE